MQAKKTSSPISIHDQLLRDIGQLKIEKQEKEVVLKQSFNNVVEALNPFSIAKEALQEFVSDNDVKSNLASSGLKLGFTIISNKLLGKYDSIKGFIGAVISEKIYENIIRKNAPKIMLTIARMFSSKPNQANSTS